MRGALVKYLRSVLKALSAWTGGGGLPSHLPGPSPVPRPWEVFREDLPANHYVRKMPWAFAHFSATSPM